MHTVRVQNLFMSVFYVCVVVFFIPSMARAEQIDSFTADIEVRKDAILKVKETIAYKFDSQKHGIFRCIPTKHQDKASSAWKERYIDIQIEEVHMDAQSVPFEITEERSQVCVKIGDPNSTVSGARTYELTYTVGGAISYETYGGADLYWNVTGHAWEVPILTVDTRVTSPDQIFMTERSCYRGLIGKTNSCQMSTDEQGVIHFGGTMFGPKEGLTLAQALDRSKIPTDIRERYRPLLVGLVGAILSILALSYFVYRYNTKFKTGDTIIPQYEPYPGVKPMYMGALFDGKLDPRDITAGIVYLAERGYIKISKTEKKVFFFFEVDDYEITLIKVPDETVSDFEKSTLKLLFETLTSANVTVTLSALKEDAVRQTENFKNTIKLQGDISKDLKENGFFESNPYLRFIGYILGINIVGLTVLVAIGNVFSVQTAVAIFIVSLIVSVLFAFTDRRTRKGYEALDHLKGFRQFLEVTEKQRYLFHNAPQKSPEQFMEYLPYAIAFGVEKEWAKTFEGITIPNPTWYDSGNSATAFSAMSLSKSLGGFSSSLAMSSGSSPSSGGGSSGGGSGGGGGGSW